jgi:hypothetical protein|tara:strand:- start:594 stop:1379 length:786 start_codon:yes stop_codon:yes gene_type:complete
MRDYVRNIVDITDNDISDSSMDVFIREGYNAVVYSEKRWPFYEFASTFSTVASQKDYPLSDVGTSISVAHDGVTFSGASAPSNPGIRQIASLKTDRHVLTFIGYDDGDIIYPLNSNTTGNPWYWAMWGDGSSASPTTSMTVRLFPTPSSVDTIYVRGYRNAIDFGGLTAISRTAVADADTPDWPDPFDQVLTLYVTYRSYQQQEDAGMANQYFALFQGELDNLRARFEDTPSPQPLRLNSRNASRWRSQVYMPDRLRYSWE